MVPPELSSLGMYSFLLFYVPCKSKVADCKTFPTYMKVVSPEITAHECLKNDYEYVLRTIVTWAGPFNHDSYGAYYEGFIKCKNIQNYNGRRL